MGSPVQVHQGASIVADRVLVQTGSITGPGVLVTETPGQPGVLVNETDSGVGEYIQYDTVAPAAPAALLAIGGNGMVQVSWVPSPGATSYDIQSSPDGTTWTTIS